MPRLILVRDPRTVRNDWSELVRNLKKCWFWSDPRFLFFAGPVLVRESLIQVLFKSVSHRKVK